MTNIYKSAAGQKAVETFYRNGLDRWPVARRELTVPTRHGDTFVVVSGEAHQTPVVLLHGSGTNSLVWMKDAAALSRRFRVYAVDLIGEPGFSASSRPSFRSTAYAEWLDDVWRELGLAGASIVAMSLGAWIALDYAVRRPQRVRSLTLLSPSGIGRQNQLFLIKAAALLLFGTLGRRRSMRAAGGSDLPRGVADYVTLIFKHFRPRMEKLPLRTDAELAALEMPVQVIVGGRDAMIHATETCDRVRRHVTDADIVYLEDAGHMLPPQTERILAFLERASGANDLSENSVA